MRTHIAGRGRGLNEEGYTLTEMLVVMAIIGLIAAVLTPSLMGQLGRARAKTAQMQLDTLASAVESYRSDVGHYPTGSQGVAALLTDPGEGGWKGPYVKNSNVLNDPWGHPVQYQVGQDGQSFTVTSLGRDGQPGGTGLDADLVSPAQAQ
jgi:general secretion pathway protein G